MRLPEPEQILERARRAVQVLHAVTRRNADAVCVTDEGDVRRSLPTWVRVTALASAMGLAAAACTSADTRAQLSVKVVPVDLAFGGEDKFEKPKQQPIAPPVPASSLDLPTFDFEKKLPPIEFVIPETCNITQPGVRVAAPTGVPMEGAQPEEAGHLFEYSGEFVEEGETVALKDVDAIRDVSSTFAELGRLPNLDNGPSTEMRRGFRFEVHDKFTGIRTMFKVMPGDDPSQVNPEVGLFLQRIAFPHGRNGEYDRNLTGGISYFEPTPSPKIASFPMQDGSTESWVGFDALTQKFITSKATVIKRDNQVRTCGEWAAGWQVRWTLSVAELPDIGLLARPACEPGTIAAAILPLLNPSGVMSAIRNATDTYRNEVRDRVGATEPIWALFDQLLADVPDVPGREQIIATYEEQLEPTLVRICNLDDAGAAFDAMDDAVLVQRMAGDNWYATQFGGFPIKDELTLKGAYLNGSVSSNLKHIQTLTGEL